MHWDEAASTLTIGSREGSFPGMIPSRRISVSRVSSKGQEDVLRTVQYDGNQTGVTF